MASCKHTDVVIIGNGPSGISLSYLLSGWTPYHKPSAGIPDDDLLAMRLSDQLDIPITEMNLRELSDGLEGRTSNPVALVFDQLCHPYADVGMGLPSQLRWSKEESRAVRHVVIGKEARPGGVWQNVQGDLKTLSRSSWMGLPGYSFKEFLSAKSKESGETISYKLSDRATVSHVANYYERYVKEKGLSDNFMNSSVVTSVERVPVHPEFINEDTGEAEGDIDAEYVWEVTGYHLLPTHNASDRQFRIRANNVVLATGTTDIPNRIKVPGEELDFVRHNVTTVSKELRYLSADSDPVLVVGAGLSAADAILAARKMDLNIIHVFRETPCDNAAQMMKKLPKAIYPEYVQMYELMCGTTEAEWYKPYPQFNVESFLDNNRVMLENGDGDSEILEISLALVQIGASPNLSFMPSDGRYLGLVDGMKINSKHNPLDVDPFTNESVSNVGLYGLGPLVGDNFVRFIKGGAIAIAQHIQMKNGIISM